MFEAGLPNGSASTFRADVDQALDAARALRSARNRIQAWALLNL